MNSSAIVHISKPAGVKSGFYKCGHGMYPVDIESMDKIKIQPRDYSEKKNYQKPKQRFHRKLFVQCLDNIF